MTEKIKQQFTALLILVFIFCKALKDACLVFIAIRKENIKWKRIYNDLIKELKRRKYAS